MKYYIIFLKRNSLQEFGQSIKRPLIRYLTRQLIST